MRHRAELGRRSFLKHAGTWGATALAAAGGLGGCPAAASKAGRTHALWGAALVFQPGNGMGYDRYRFQLSGAAPEVGWTEEIRGRRGVETLAGFVRDVWPSHLAGEGVHGAAAGVIAGTAERVGLRVVVRDLTLDSAGTGLSGTAEVIARLWDEHGQLARGADIALDEATLFLLPPSPDAAHPSHFLLHHAREAQVIPGTAGAPAGLELRGLPEHLGWAHTGAARLGGRIDLDQLGETWADRFAAGAAAGAWLWREANGVLSAERAFLTGLEHDAGSGMLRYGLDGASPSLAKDGGPAMLLTDGGNNGVSQDAFTRMRFTREHEWVLRDGDVFKSGVTEYYAEELGGVVFVDILDDSRPIALGDMVGTVEAVKTVSDLYAPLACKNIQFNQQVNDYPERVNQDPYAAGWLYQAEATDFGPLEDLMTYAQYKNYVYTLD